MHHIDILRLLASRILTHDNNVDNKGKELSSLGGCMANKPQHSAKQKVGVCFVESISHRGQRDSIHIQSKAHILGTAKC